MIKKYRCLPLYIFLLQILLNISCTLNSNITSLSKNDSSILAIPKLQFSVSAVAVDESSGSLDLSITMDSTSTEDIEIFYETKGTAAGSGVDYALTSSNPKKIMEGKKNAVISLNLINDGYGDAGETIIVELIKPNNAELDSNNKLTVTLTETQPSLVSSSNKLTSNSTFSYVDLDVDWSRGMAYLSSRKSNICVEAVDFNNESAPAIIKIIGSATLNVCLGVKLFDNNTKLLVSSLGNNKLAAWDLTSSPVNVASWASLGEYAIGDNGKRISKINFTGSNNWEIYSTKRFGVIKTNLLVTGSTGTFTLLNSTTSGLSFNSSAVIGDRFLAQSLSGTVQPVGIYNLSLVSQTSLSTLFWNWSSDSNAAGDKAYLGGSPGGAFFGYVGSTTTLYKKFIYDSSCTVRSSDIVIQGASEYVYSLCSNGRIDVFDVTDITNPILVKTGQLTSFESEAYAIKVKPNSNKAVVVTNRGDFLILNLDGLSATSTQYAVDP